MTFDPDRVSTVTFDAYSTLVDVDAAEQGHDARTTALSDQRMEVWCAGEDWCQVTESPTHPYFALLGSASGSDVSRRQSGYVARRMHP